MAVIHSSLGSAGCILPCSSEKCAAVKSPSRLTVQKGPWWRGVPRARPQSLPASAKFFNAKMLYYAIFIYFQHVTPNLTGIPGAKKDVQICLRLGCWTNSQLDRVISYLGQVDLPNMGWRWNELKYMKLMCWCSAGLCFYLDLLCSKVQKSPCVIQAIFWALGRFPEPLLVAQCPCL